MLLISNVNSLGRVVVDTAGNSVVETLSSIERGLSSCDDRVETTGVSIAVDMITIFRFLKYINLVCIKRR